jgi:hypothetical protein
VAQCARLATYPQMDSQPGTSKLPARRLCILGGLLLLAIFAVMAWQSTGPSEPVYEGKPLSHWLQGHTASSAADPPYGSAGWQKANEVLKRAGTNALPTMLKLIAAKDPPPRVLKLMQFFRYPNMLFKNYRYASTRNEEARYAFEVLGRTAAPAVPALVKIYERNVSPESKRCVASALHSIGKAAQPALPALLNDFTNANRQERFDAVTATISIGGDPKILILALQSMLKDPMHEIRANAAVALDVGFGSRARASVPALLEARDDLARGGDKVQTGIIEQSLWHIAPESVGKPLNVEDARSMITNGITSEALDLESSSRRRTLIPAGKRVPCEGQFWTQQPRGPFTLYRNSGATTNAARNLGEYEVIGIKPPPADVNVSLLLVVTESKIILCARANEDHPEFLEIRRVR